MALFPSDEWAKAMQKEINANKEMAKAGKGFDATIQSMIKGAGKRGDIPFWTHMKDGKVLEASSGKKKCDCNIGARHQCGKMMTFTTGTSRWRTCGRGGAGCSPAPAACWLPTVAPIAAESCLSPGQSSM